MKHVIRIPYVKWRDGRPRFEPSPALRAHGWRGEDLRHGPEIPQKDGRRVKIGPWFTIEECLAFAAQLAPRLKAHAIETARAKKARKRAPQPGAPVAAEPVWLTVDALFEAWLASPRLAGSGESQGKRQQAPVSANTRADYRAKRATLIKREPEFMALPVDALTAPIVYDLYERLWNRAGLATARGCIAVLSAALAWGIRRGRVRLATNPAKGLGMQAPAPRLRVLTQVEFRRLIAAADAIGRPEIGDAIMLGVWTGQRQADRLAMVDAGVDRHGRRVLRQSKTRAVVAIPDSPALAHRLAETRARRAAWGVQPTLIVVDERQRKPFLRRHYARLFETVRAAAVAGVFAPDGAVLVEPTPSLADARDQDLRDTAVTWLAAAGCSIPEICQITGHKLQSAGQVLKHYLASNPELADSAMAKLIAYIDREAAADGAGPA